MAQEVHAYLDESGIHQGAVACVIAGYYGGQRAMADLKDRWLNTLKRFNFPLERFHAKELIKRRENDQLLQELSRAIAATPKALPVSQAIIVNDFNSLSFEERRFLTGATLKNGVLVSSGAPSKPYFVPFQLVLKIVTDHTPIGGRAQFNFGIDRNFSDYARSLFLQIESQFTMPHYSGSWKSRDRLGNSIFPKAAETPQLQAADLLAHLEYKYLINQWIPNVDRGKVPSLLRLCRTNRRIPFSYQDRECLDGMLRQARSIDAQWKACGHNAGV